MRGKIIQYNGADGSGTIVADGRQYRFELMAWRGDSAPAVNKTVEIELDGDKVTSAAPVGEDVLLKEKAAEWGGKLSGALKQGAAAARNAAPSGGGGAGGGAATGAQAMPAAASIPGLDLIRARYGLVIPITWFLFLLGTLAFNTVSMAAFGQSRGWSMFDISSMLAQFGGGGGGFLKFLLIVGYLSIAVPLVWRNRLAWLALLLPLIAVLWGIFQALHATSGMSQGVTQGMSDLFSLGFGFWLSLIMSIILAGATVMRFLKSS